MIPLKGRNAPKSRDKPEEPKYILEAVAEADRLRTLELVCVEHRWKVVHVDLKEHCLECRCQRCGAEMVENALPTASKPKVETHKKGQGK